TPCFAAESAEAQARYVLWRRPVAKSETKIGERVHVREETATQAGQKLEKALAGAGASAVQRESKRFGRSFGVPPLSGVVVHSQAGERACGAYVFKGSGGDSLYTLVVEAPGATETKAFDELSERFTDQLGFDLSPTKEWYQNQLTVGAPLATNLLFSIGSSLA